MGNRFYLLLMWVGCHLIYMAASLVALISIVIGSQHARNIIVSSDRLLNALTGGRDNETLSSRAYRGTQGDNKAKRWCLLCKILDFIQEDHCKKSEGV